ncbi:MAG: formate dehydrogenase accessory sulfurtransferase FdhD, partial [Flavobacteriales bacterium]|nr:formate dehydrogenase accessory sulfurtransferase FdhD [Flavobacteriales bacterium]
MDNTKYLRTVVIEKLIGNEAAEVEDVTIEEARLTLYLNGEKTISMMTIPKDQDAHVVGFLMSENVISSIADIEKITVSEDGLRVDVIAKINEDSLQNLYKEKTLTSGCGGGITGNIEGSLEIPFNQTAFKVKPETISSEI